MRTHFPARCTAALWLLLFCSFTASLFAAPTVYSGKVVSVTDGDTLHLLVQRTTIKVRLAEIDAPEKSQAFGTQSKKTLSNIVFGKEVLVVEQDRDRYGRMVGTVYVGDVNANVEMIRRGMAWVYVRYAKDPALFQLEDEARIAKRGLWADPHAIPPWEYRYSQNGSSRLLATAAETATTEVFTGNGKRAAASSATRPSAATTSEAIIGNRKSKIYHWPGCPNYHGISPKNQVFFTSRTEAEAAGFRAARNCR
jgi:micrococcal nuclease